MKYTPPKILVVDENPQARQLIGDDLRTHSYSVLEAANAQEALELIPQEKPDLVTLDIDLPDMDGFTLCRTLSEPEYAQHYTSKPSGHLPVIIITDNDTLEVRNRGFEIGAADFLTKPFYEGEVLKAVNKIIRPNKRLIGLTALVVDDSNMARRICSQLLRREGLTVFECSDGVEAFSFMQEMHEKIDMVVTDLKMPNMEGDELCQKLRQELHLTDLPIIFLTAVSDHKLLIQMFAMGATDYIVKPFVKEELIARLKVHLERAQLTRNLKRIIGSLKRANDEIRTLSITDTLTGCYNRNYMETQLKREIRTAFRYRRNLSILMCDIDHFKSVNDRYGHTAGDEVLKAFTQRILEGIRLDIDWVVRFGGEEFLVVLPETNLEDATTIAERLRKRVAESPIDLPGASLSITASFGGTGFTHQQTDPPVTITNLLNTADKLLYESKNNGRNRVSIAPLASSHPPS